MIEKNTVQLVLAHFFDNPTTPIHLRELSRKVGLSMPPILAAVAKLVKKGLLLEKKERAWTMVRADVEGRDFIRLKRTYNMEQLYASGLVDHLIEKTRNPAAIICFGSYSRGEDIESSDIDIAVIGAKDFRSPLDIYEKRLKRSVSVHMLSWDRINQELKSNIQNGIILEGMI